MTTLFLLLDLEGRKTFDPEKVRTCLQAENVYNWRGQDQHRLFECHFDFDGDSTIFALASDRRSANIDGMGPASIELALRLQRCYGEEIHAMDDEFVADIRLSGVASVAEFEEKLSAAYRALKAGQDTPITM